MNIMLTTPCSICFVSTANDEFFSRSIHVIFQLSKTIMSDDKQAKFNVFINLSEVNGKS